MNKTELMTEIMKLTGHSRSLHPDVHFGILRLINKYVESTQSARIRELEGLLDKTVNLLLKMPDEINDFELIEEAENALNKTKPETDE